ncbi:MAG: tol-pal system protein YbgF [Nitrospinota bacterium]
MILRMGGIAVGLVVLLAGCVTTEEIDLLRSDVRKLKREVRQLRDDEGRIRQDLESAVEPVTDRLQVLQQEVEAVRRIQADFESRLATTQREAAKATGSTEERQFRERSIGKDLRELKEALEARLAALEGEVSSVKDNLGAGRPRASAPAPAPPATTVARPRVKSSRPAGPVAPTPRTRNGGPIPSRKTTAPPVPRVIPAPAVSVDDRAHSAALALLKAGKSRDARKKFQEFLRRFPTSPLADNAQYGIGETYYKEKRYDKAILEYDKVVINYAKGDKVPGALLKQGLAFLALGDKASAKQLLSQLVKEYPDSTEAKTAQSKLSSL